MSPVYEIIQIIEQVKRLSPAERGQVAVEVVALVSEDVQQAARPPERKRSYTSLLALAGTGSATGVPDVSTQTDAYLAQSYQDRRRIL